MFIKRRKEDIKLTKLMELRKQKESLKKEINSQKIVQKELKEINALERMKNDGKPKKIKALPRSVENSIKYLSMVENGVCRVADDIWSKTIKFEDIDYKFLKEEEQQSLFNKYCNFHNSFNQNTSVQFTIFNHKISDEVIKDDLLINSEGNNKNSAALLIDDINMEIQRKLSTTSNMINTKYLTFSLKATTYEEAVRNLSHVETEMDNSLQELKCIYHPLNGLERLELMQNILRPYEHFTFMYSNLLRSGLTTKAYITPPDINFSNDKYVYSDGTYLSTLIVRDFPKDIKDTIITDLYSINCDLVINIHIQAINDEVSKKEIDTKIMFMESDKISAQNKAIQKNYSVDLIPHELQQNLEEAYLLRDMVENHGQKIFNMTFTITTYERDFEKLESNLSSIVTKIRQHGCVIEYLYAQQEESLNTCLPLGVNHLLQKRTMPTCDCAIMLPFQTQDVFDKNGIYYGVNTISNNIIKINRTNLKTPSEMVFAITGGGKSMFTKMELIQDFAKDKDAEFLILDPEGEYIGLTKELGGITINIDNNSETHINIFDIDLCENRNQSIRNMADFALTVINMMLGDDKLTAIQKSIVDQCVVEMYDDYFKIKSQTKADMPTLKQLQKKLFLKENDDALYIAKSIEIYVSGSLNLFSYLTNVNIKNRLLNYNLKNITANIKPLAMLIILNDIWNRVRINDEKGIHTYIKIDEFSFLLKSDICATFFTQLWKQIRKYGGIATGITQNVTEVIKTNSIESLLLNTEFLVLLNQSPNDAFALADLLDLSDEQVDRLVDAKSGQGLLCVGNKIKIPFENIISKDTFLYKTLSTKFEEKMNNE